MKKLSLVKLVILFVTTIALSGCVVAPWGWDDGGHYGGSHHGGGYYGGGHRGMGDHDGDGGYAYNRGGRY